MLQNARAYVNAAFSMQVDPNSTVQGTPVLVFGGIQAHAVSTALLELFRLSNSFLPLGVGCKHS